MAQSHVVATSGSRTRSVLEASMERSDSASLLTVSAGLHPPLLPSYRMSRQMWPLL